jgi:hypothetical protein
MATDRSVLLDAGGKPLPRPVVYLAYASTTAQARSARNPIGPSDPAHPRARHDRDAALLDDRFHQKKVRD